MEEKIFQTNTTHVNPLESHTTTATSADIYNAYCNYRLPCGICTRTNSMCPRWNQWSITWAGDPYKVTLGDNTYGRNEVYCSSSAPQSTNAERKEC